MKTFYDVRNISPSKEKWRYLIAKVLLTSKKKYLIKIVKVEAKVSDDLLDKYIVCPKDDYLDKDLYITTSFWSALRNFLFKKIDNHPEFPEELL